MRFSSAAARLFLAVLALLAGAAAVVRAHDAYEITAETRTRADHLELVITLARSTASYASGADEAERRTFDVGEFEQARPRLIAAAPRFFTFRLGQETLAARTVEAALTEEKDVELRLTYARPAGGKVIVKGQVFTVLPQEPYGSTFHFYGPKGELLAHKFINADDPFVEAALPENAKAPTGGHNPADATLRGSTTAPAPPAPHGVRAP